MSCESCESVESLELAFAGPPCAQMQIPIDAAHVHEGGDVPELVFVTHRLTRDYPRTLVPPRAGELHLWRFRSEWLPVTVQQSDSWLSRTERERARLHPSAAQRKRFVAARVVLRWIIGHLFDCSPRAVEFQEAGDESLYARHPRDGRNIMIDIAYGGIWIVVGLASTTLGLGIAVPSLPLQVGEAGHARQRARHESLANALRHVHRTPLDIEPETLDGDANARLVDLADRGVWHLIDLPMPGKICASVALAQPVVRPLMQPFLQVQAFGWPKVSLSVPA